MEPQTEFFTPGARSLQDQFDTRRVAERLEQVQVHRTFTVEDRALIDNASMFFLATTSLDGQPECSYKGGRPGFVRILDEQSLAFPDYNGNGMFRSLGNVLENPKVALLFVDFERPQRLRLNGTAALSASDPLMSEFPGAQLIVRIRVGALIPNCPRYVHPMRMVEPSIYCPAENHTPPVPDWKRWHDVRTELPRSEPVPPLNLRARVRWLTQCSPLVGWGLNLFRRSRAALRRR